jgi:A/G-specific adenine glycosylase
MPRQRGIESRSKRGTPAPCSEVFRAVAEALARHEPRRFPWRETADPYQLLVVELLLHRTRPNLVGPVYAELLARYPTVAALADADRPDLEALTARLGFAKRADIILRVARYIRDELGGRIPDSYEALIRVPFIGIYTAAAVLCLAHSQPIAMVDVNTVRILSRVLSLIPREDSPRGDPAMIAAADTVVLCLPDKAPAVNLAFIDVGALYCKKTPVCEPCPLNAHCNYYRTLK